MKTEKPGIGCFLTGLLISTVFILAGAGGLYVGFVAPKQAIKEAENWVETPCEILESKLREEKSTTRNRDSPSTTTYFYIIDVKFKYAYKGNEYISDRFDFSNADDGEEDWKRELIAKLAPGTKTVCYVNPSNPAEAVLSREFILRYGAAIAPVVFIVMGLVVLGLMIFHFRTS